MTKAIMITAEELRIIVRRALFDEYVGGTVDECGVELDELPMPDDSALMQAATMTNETIAAYVVEDEAGKGDTPLLKYADELATIMFFDGEENV